MFFQPLFSVTERQAQYKNQNFKNRVYILLQFRIKMMIFYKLLLLHRLKNFPILQKLLKFALRKSLPHDILYNSRDLPFRAISTHYFVQFQERKKEDEFYKKVFNGFSILNKIKSVGVNDY